jgi:hypothetical protein
MVEAAFPRMAGAMPRMRGQAGQGEADDGRSRPAIGGENGRVTTARRRPGENSAIIYDL